LVWAVREFKRDVDIATKTAAAMKIVGADDTLFTLEPGKKVTLVLSMASQFKHEDPLEYVKESLAKIDDKAIGCLWQKHQRWWDEYLVRSWIDIGDPVLEEHYYQSLCMLGAASRDPEFPPGIFGTWVTGDKPSWTGAYTLNYNHYAPFYGLYSANRIEQADPQDAPLLAFRPRGRWYAENVTNTRGVLFPVGCGVLGMGTRTNPEGRWKGSVYEEKGGLFLMQRSNASYSLVNFAQRWRTTYDLDYAKKVYPFVKEVAEFWEDYLKFEDGRYIDQGDAIHECSGWDVNPILALGLIRNVMDLAVDMSSELGVDLDRHEKWEHIQNNLSGFITQEIDGKEVFRYTEKGKNWWANNTLGIQHIYPANAIGIDSDERLLEISRNTLDVMGRWHDSNGSNSFFPAAVRVGFDPEVIYANLIKYAKFTYPNGFMTGNPHGIENYSTVPNTINMMLCMSHVPVGNAYLQGQGRDEIRKRPESVIRLFAVWPKEKDAKFKNIRTWGAFLVSSMLKDEEVEYVKVVSEQGRDCTVVNPWPGKKVLLYRNGRKAETLEGERLIFKTSKGEKLVLGPDGVSYKELIQRMTQRVAGVTPTADIVKADIFNKVSISVPVVDGAAIYYTVDGQRPTKNSARYKGPFELAKSATVRAIAIAAGYEDSEIAEVQIDVPIFDEVLENKIDTKGDFDRLIFESEFENRPVSPRWIERSGQKVGNPNPGKNGIAVCIPPYRHTDCIVKRYLKLPKGKTAKLKIVTSADPWAGEADFVLKAGIVTRNRSQWFDKEVISAGPEPSEKDWKTFEYDLSAFAGEDLAVIVKAIPGGKHSWSNERAYFDEISVIVY